MSNILANILGQQTGGILGIQPQVGGIAGPAQPPVQGPTTGQQVGRLFRNPAFISALSNLSGALVAPGPVGERFGTTFARGLSGFAPDLIQGLQQQEALQNQRQRQQLQDQLIQAQIEKTQAEALTRGIPAETSLQKNLRAAGIDPASERGRNIVLQSLTKPATQVNIGGEKAFEAETGKLEAKEFSELIKQGRSARQANITLGRLDDLLAKGDLGTGALANTKLAAGSFAKAFGLDPKILGIDQLSSLEEFSGLASQLTLQAADQIAGALSDKDIELLRSSVPNLQNTPEGNRRKIQFQKGLNNRKIEVNKSAQEWVRRFGRLSAAAPDGSTFDDVQVELAKESIFDDLQPVTTEQPQQAGPLEGQTATNPQTGGRIIFRGGQWQPL